MPEPLSLPIQGEVHHYGYVVQDLEPAIDGFINRLGAGPFFVMKNVALQDVSSGGEPAVFFHSSAFAQCGSFTIELMEIHRVEPVRAHEGFSQPRPGLHHVAWVTPDLDEGIQALEQQGIASYLRAGLGAIRFSYHDANDLLGHHVELHHDNDELRGFFEMIRGARRGWDGSDPIRTMG